MRAIALATALVACGGERAAPNPSLAGIAPAVDALIAAVTEKSLAKLDAIIAEPIALPLHHATKLWQLAGAKTRLAGVDAGGGVVMWDARTGRPMASYHSAITAPDKIAISADGEHLELCAGASAEVIDLGTGAKKLVDGGTCPIESKERWVATPRGLVDPETEQVVLAIPDAAAVFGDGLATLRDDAATLWTFGGLLIGHADAIVSIVPRDDRLLTASRDGRAIVWKNSAIQHALPRSSSPLVGAGFVTDTRIAAGDAEGNVTLWDLDSTTALAHATYPTGLACLAVQRDGRVAIATTDGHFETLDAVLTHPAPLATSPCGSLATSVVVGEWKITGDAHGNLRIHPTTLGGAIARACGILRRFDRADEAGCT